jgi:hypothetical protein
MDKELAKWSGNFHSVQPQYTMKNHILESQSVEHYRGLLVSLQVCTTNFEFYSELEAKVIALADVFVS